MHQIQDDNGVIHSGTMDEMVTAYAIMIAPEDHSDDEIVKYGRTWNGDLQLIEVHATTR